LPGSDKEKTRVYEEPYYAICSELFQRGDAYELLKNKNVINFLSTSYLRGLTVSDSIVVIEECQNYSFAELDTIMTRIGEDCRVIFSGDFKQSDLKTNGLKQFFGILQKMPADFEFIEFTSEDVVRGGLVKRYIQAREKEIGI
jgi:phosphate starvation-inducible protein PhoH